MTPADSPIARLVQLSTVGALAYCSYTMCRSPVVPLFARDLGASPATVGLVVAASTLTGVALKFPAGAFSDVLGRRAVLLAGVVVFAVLPFSYLAVGGVAALVCVRVVHGSATASSMWRPTRLYSSRASRRPASSSSTVPSTRFSRCTRAMAALRWTGLRRQWLRRKRQYWNDCVVPHGVV